jgi:AcrR family transcriptional regulator
VSPKIADPSQRVALVEAAARLLADEGRSSLTLRRLASEVGTSTMAIYTHFGGMPELMREIRREGFARLRARLSSLHATNDPVADVAMLGWAYWMTATEAPDLYRAMFMEHPIDEEDLASGLDTFMTLVGAISRCRDAGRFPNASTTDPSQLAVDVWALTHGLVSLQLAGLLPSEQALARLDAARSSLFLAWGDRPETLSRSRQRTRRRAAAHAIARPGPATEPPHAP